MERRTKIIATIGPASESDEVLGGLIDAGMDVARLGLAHGTLDEHLDRYHRIRKLSEDRRRPVGLLVDLPGPKIRTTNFADGGAEVHENDTIDIRVGTDDSTGDVILVDYDALLADLRPGDRLGFGDGHVVVDIEDTRDDVATTRVVAGGLLMGRPGLRIPSDRLSMGTPTPQDLKMLDVFVEEGVDMVAISFVRSAHDVRRVGTEPAPRGPVVIAKIETRAAIDNLPGIIDAAGAIMVARGDLGTECNIEEIPHLQKKIIRDSVSKNLPTITATQMLDSMVSEIQPTRAEATDVANAVFDGASALMLSAETAVGDDPVHVVETMARIAKRADEEFDSRAWVDRVVRTVGTSHDHHSADVTDAMTLAAWRAVDELGVDTIVCITNSGFTVRSMARFRPAARILGFSEDPRTVQQLTLSWGATPMLAQRHVGTFEQRAAAALTQVRDAGHVRSGDLVGVLAGIDPRSAATDTLRIARVP